MRLRRIDDANLWSGIRRLPDTRRPRTPLPKGWGIPTLIITVRPRYWSLPFSLSIGGHLLSKPGCTFGVGPFYFSWSRL